MNLSEVRSELGRIGVTPSKVLGQNFLHDANMAAWIVGRLDVDDDGPVVEVGPGLGALTGVLAGLGRRVLAIERDRKLAGRLEEVFGGAGGCVEVVAGDAARFDVRQLHPEGIRSFIGNLPYSAAAPILFQFLQAASPIREAVVMVQSEMARRFAAAPGSPDYGSAAVVLQRLWRIRLLKTVPPSVFYPRPRVDSVVMKFGRRGAEGGEALPPCEESSFERLVRLGFSQRRKQLGNLLKNETPDWREAFRELGLAESCRAEELDVAQWVALANLAAGWGGAPAQSPDTEVFDVVDECNRVVGRETRAVVHERGLRHRAVHVFVVNGAGELFLQKRSAFKDRHPGVWDSSASGHLDAGESCDACARRELREELGIDAAPVPLGVIEACRETGWEFVQVYRARSEGPFRLPPAEIEAGAFFPPALIGRWIASRPHDFAPGFLACHALACDRLGGAASFALRT